jgi:predicted Zn finger-like uncharacterized protein
MSQLVTRCPHCSTSFHVNEQQLRAARGAVRCGSCLQVFRADENIVFNEGDPQPASGKDLEALLEDDDFLIHDDIDLEGDESESKPPPPPPKVTAPAVERPLIDDAFGEDRWHDTDNDTSAEGDDGELSPGRDTSWGDETPEPPRKRESANATRWEQSHPGDNFSQRFQRMGRHAAGNPQATGLDDELLDGLSAPRERERLISAIEPAPLEVGWRPQQDRRLPNWGWALLTLLLLISLAAQLAYFRFDSLSKREPWRGIYARLCPILNCRLPPLVDLGAIRTSNLVVRSHPQMEGALVVDAVLLNTAPFAQPFPSLLLNFSDLKNQPVASRLFSPRDYLQGELAGRTQMPIGNPVHIAIEIVDPGKEAVNYELHIAP